MNFQIVETPFSLKLSIKKAPVKIYQENIQNNNQNQIFNVPPPMYSPQSQPIFPTEDSNQQLEAKNSDLQSDLKCAAEKNLSLSTELNALKIENQKLKEVANGMKFEIKKEEKYLEAELDTTTKENKTLKSDLEKKTATIVNLKEENGRLISEQKNLESELKDKDN